MTEESIMESNSRKRSTRSTRNTISKTQVNVNEKESSKNKYEPEQDGQPKKVEPESKFESTFDIIVLGSGGGPLETDCSGYLVKAAQSSWEDGIIALEGGSGIGALASILSNASPSDLFKGLDFPPSYNTPVLQAAHVFSYLACYLITHAHLDHVGSLIMLSGSVPSKYTEHTQPPTTSLPTPSTASTSDIQSIPSKNKPSHPRPHVYGTRKTLEQLSQAYQGGLWPELGSWVPDREGDTSTEEDNHIIHNDENGTNAIANVNHKSKRRKTNRNNIKSSSEERYIVNGPNGTVEGTEENLNSCLLFSPLSTECVHRPLHPTLPISLLTYPVVHGCTSKHTYESSAMFIRYDPSAITRTPPSSSHPSPSQTITNGSGPSSKSNSNKPKKGKEFLFFGDVESSYRKKGEEEVDLKRGKEAQELNKQIWKEAAKSWSEDRLCGIFIECSYDSSRPAHLMFGHLSPPSVYHELQTLAELITTKSEKRPLEGLKVFIIHIKDALVPHPTGKTARQIIMSELNELEEKGQLGVEFVETKRGDRIGEPSFKLYIVEAHLRESDSHIIQFGTFPRSGCDDQPVTCITKKSSTRRQGVFVKQIHWSC
ncbi:uncharacterized protein I206_103837 [Kwoniella pini CBS 10737]|uniref:3',5'-cyclic-nucleotide phosphodiesterase n=1 Tax=Kwoniella pini CBS 10737 TaxID=1296096 RepID=A0A1B9HSQ3_9TREE|nr:uncharacterized protein I206_07790 [Kwoniella pini CBS 10737]OCF46309.1 hypothetical protein I206_07790 [Kwoniella pini CBS 10737]